MLIENSFIFPDADVQTAEACIRLAAAAFEAEGCVRAGYADSVAAREKKYPTGLPGRGINIAIPHTTSELVDRPAIGVVVPREPVPFSMMGAPDTVLSCGLIFPLVIKDAHQQIDMLKKMRALIPDSELLLKIRQAGSKEEILGYLRVLSDDE